MPTTVASIRPLHDFAMISTDSPAFSLSRKRKLDSLTASFHHDKYIRPSASMKADFLVPTHSRHPCVSRKRTRVCFQSAPEPVKSTYASFKIEPKVHYIESLVNLPQEQKNALWVQDTDIHECMNTIRKTCQNERKNSAATCSTYGKTLTDVYIACCNDSKGKDEEIPHSIASNELEVLGTGSRGLECCVVPELSAKRSQLRKKNIRGVLAIHHRLRPVRILGGDDVANAMLRSVAERLSRPSRKFARALGIGDSLAALIEYTNESPIVDDGNAAVTTSRKSSLVS